MSRLAVSGILAAAVLVQAGAVNAESYTTRIEPRPFYGAVVTLEHGVRVIRPLPPERQVIINPNGTPLNLGFNDTRVYEKRSIYNYGGDGGSAGTTGGDAVYSAPYFGYGRGFARGRNRPGDHFGDHGAIGHSAGGVR